MLTPLIVSWEYPPRIVGDMAYYVESLTEELNRAKTSVSVVTCRDSTGKYERRSDLLEIYWASNPVDPHISVLTWCLTLNAEIERIVSDIIYDKKDATHVLDIQDWHFVPAGVSLKRAHGLPFILTVHSLEEQRSPGSSGALSSCIRGLETMGLIESDLVLVKTDRMKALITEGYEVQKDKIVVVSNNGPNWGRRILAVYREVAKGRRA